MFGKYKNKIMRENECTWKKAKSKKQSKLLNTWEERPIIMRGRYVNLFQLSQPKTKTWLVYLSDNFSKNIPPGKL